MTRKEHLEEYRKLVKRSELAADRIELTSDRNTKNMEEFIKHTNALMDDLMGAIAGVNELSKGFAVLLNQTSIKLLSKNIHQLIDEHKTNQENGKKFEPGIPQDILKRVDK